MPYTPPWSKGPLIMKHFTLSDIEKELHTYNIQVNIGLWRFSFTLKKCSGAKENRHLFLYDLKM